MKKALLFFISFLFYINISANNAEYYQREIAAAQAAQNLELILQLYSEYIEGYDQIEGDKEDKKLLIHAYATMLSYAGEHKKALQLLFSVFDEIKQDPEHEELTARYAMQIGIAFFFMNQFDNALIYYEKAEKIVRKINNLEGLSIAINNIGNIYQKQFQYQKAIEAYNECLELQKTVNDSATIANTLFNIGTCYEELGMFEEALAQFTQSKEMANAIGENEMSALSSIHIGVISQNPAIIEEAIALIGEGYFREVLKVAYHKHAEITARSHNFETAYQSLTHAYALQDSIYQDENEKVLNEFKIKHENEKLENEKRLQRLYSIFGASAFLLIIISLLVVLRAHRKTNKKLREINNAKDKVFSVISHELKNPLIAQKKVLEILDKNLEHFSAKEIKEMSDELLNSSKSVLKLLYNLLDWSKVERKIIPFQPTQLHLQDVLDGVLEEMNIALKQKNITVNVSIPSDLSLYADTLSLSVIIRNILDNAAKYSNPNSHIDISAKIEDGKCHISIQDYGVGMTQKTINKLFKLSALPSKKGTQGETGGGIGMMISKELVAMHGGVITVNSQENMGTTFVFTINQKQ